MTGRKDRRPSGLLYLRSMATYKLIQDIEAEDHILGPLTLRQFIFALVACFFGWLCFVCVTKGAPFMLIVFGPPLLFCGFFALPFGRDQPTEIWALAKLRYWFKPRERVWNQSGVKELVTITVPKKIERVFTNGLSQIEVHSRLQALANTIDSRGWAIKNVSLNTFTAPALVPNDSDRLIDIQAMPQEVPANEIAAAEDILDETNNPIARQFEAMITQSSQARRQQLIDQLNSHNPMPALSEVTGQAASAATQPWFLSPSTTPTNSQPDAAPVGLQSSSVPAAADPTPEEITLSAQVKAHASSQHVSYDHLKTIQPLGPGPAAGAGSDWDGAAAAAAASPQAPVNSAAGSGTASGSISTMTAADDAAILSLANNNDLNVATLAREAQKAMSTKEPLRDEVVISLH